MRVFSLFRHFLLGVLFNGLILVVAHAAPDAERILQLSDEVRNPQQSYKFQAKVTSFKSKKPSSEGTYKVMVKGREKTLIQTITPPVDRGRVLLMSGSNFWGYLPNVSKPIRISLQERLLGEVANGDLARVNFSGDYSPVLKETKKIKGQTYFILDMKAKSEDVTYGRVVLWVKANGYRPHFAEFYAFSGRLLKTCKYQEFGSLGGAVRPKKLVLTDAVNKGHYSHLEYSDMEVSDLPDKFFTKDYMKRFSP